VYVRNRPC